MRIGFDISPLESGHAGRGTGTYTRLLLDGLKQSGEVEIIEFSQKNPLTRAVDCIHHPYFDPFLVTLPFRMLKSTIVTVHDLIPIVASNNFPRGIKGEIRWQLQRHSLKQSAAIITDSEASKIDIAKFLPYPNNNIQVVYLAPGKEFSPQTEKEQHRIGVAYHLPSQFVLYVGDVNWNKNILGLIRAIQQVDVPLVFVGKAFTNEKLKEVQEINKLIKDLQLHAKIVKLGFVPAEDLPALYSAAAVYIQPSFLEGFGLPILEAMACGTSTVVANVSSLKEIAGPSIFVNPEDPDDIAKGIVKALERDNNKQKEKYIAWSQKFTWEKTVTETLNVYKHVMEENKL